MTIDIGRRGGLAIVDGAAVLCAEVSGGREAVLYRVVGLECVAGSTRVKSSRVERTKTDRSNSGNGVDSYEGLSDGIYVMKGVHETSGRIVTEMFRIAVGEIEDFGRDESAMISAAKIAFPLDAQEAEAKEAEAARLAARRGAIEAAIADERTNYAPVVRNGLAAEPVFPFIPKDVGTRGEDEDTLALDFGTPREWKVISPYVTGSTADEALAKAEAINEKRKREAEEAAAKAKEDGLPELKGTERQVAYAEEIRAKFAQFNPGHVNIKKAKTAKFWIENHKGILNR
ncbi:MAG: hypothetical protein VR70_10840 [Rhodospirillaceae bacterium BRH_c57]|nr:MAG: hypothetical protein VR70_10840 [Rhodospirillaceae bacterium BRH_c57]